MPIDLFIGRQPADAISLFLGQGLFISLLLRYAIAIKLTQPHWATIIII